MRLKHLGRALLLQVVLSQNLVDAVEYRRAFFGQPGAQSGDLSIGGFLNRGRLNPPQPKWMLSIDKLLPMNPQLVAQLAGVAAVRLLLRRKRPS